MSSLGCICFEGLFHILIGLWENPAASICLGTPGEAHGCIWEGDAHHLWQEKSQGPLKRDETPRAQCSPPTERRDAQQAGTSSSAPGPSWHAVPARLLPTSSSTAASQCLGNMYQCQAVHHCALLLNLLLQSEDFSRQYYRKAPAGMLQSCPK